MGEWEGRPEAKVAANGGRTIVRLPEDQGFQIAMGDPFVAFCHPRTLIDGWDVTQTIIERRMRKLGIGRLFPPPAVVQIMDEWEGGVTDVEQRALMEMLRHCGASSVRLIQSSRSLEPEEVRQVARDKSGMVGLVRL